MNFRKQFIKQLTNPTPIYSRNEAKVNLQGLLAENENVVFGLEKRDSILKMYRSRWFLTETKMVFISTSFPLSKNREIYLFNDIEEMRLFEDEGVLVISVVDGETGVEVKTNLEEEFARQAIEQYNRYQQAVKEMQKSQEREGSESEDNDEKTDDDETTVEE